MATHFSMRAFIVEGVLGGARPGMSRDEIRALLGEPDQWAGESVAEAGVWRYGLFEVHFDGHVAWLLYTDYVDPPDAGPGRTLDAWIFADRPPSTAEMLDRLRAERFSLCIDGPIVRIATGAALTFLDPATSTRGYDEVHGIAVTSRDSDTEE